VSHREDYSLTGCGERHAEDQSSGVKHLEALPEPIPAVNQIEIHPWCQQKPIVEYCQKHGIVLQAYSPLSRAMEDRLQDKTVNGIAQKYGKDWAQILIRWSLQKGYVDVLVEPLHPTSRALESY
jgi:diketogulonate reductase-like aldo/keto reductase